MRDQFEEKKKRIELRKKDFSDAEWKEIKQEARDILIKCAIRRSLITYKDFADQIRTKRIYYRCEALSNLLEEISEEENQNNRGMLSAIVVKKGKNPMPGKTFYKLARDLGKEPKIKIKPDQRALLMWANELRTVFGFHTTNKNK